MSNTMLTFARMIDQPMRHWEDLAERILVVLCLAVLRPKDNAWRAGRTVTLDGERWLRLGLRYAATWRRDPLLADMAEVDRSGWRNAMQRLEARGLIVRLSSRVGSRRCPYWRPSPQVLREARRQLRARPCRTGGMTE